MSPFFSFNSNLTEMQLGGFGKLEKKKEKKKTQCVAQEQTDLINSSVGRSGIKATG